MDQQTRTDNQDLAPQEAARDSAEPASERSTSVTSPTAEPGAEPAPEPTVGTGTTIALGCVAGTIVLVLFALIYLGVNALLH